MTYTTPDHSQQPIVLLQMVALLLDYPSETLYQHRQEIDEIIQASRYVSPEVRAELNALLTMITSNTLLEAQERYDTLFDRGRSLALYLFEHIHGESRSRGQAMVDLINQYQQAGLAMEAQELPDYIPLFLEFLSQQSALEAKQQLNQVADIFALLAARLVEKDSPYVACFNALLQIAGKDLHTSITKAMTQIGGEAEQDSLAALDKQWEEEAVDFMQGQQTSNTASSCSAAPQPNSQTLGQAEVPIHWRDFQESSPKSNLTQGA